MWTVEKKKWISLWTTSRTFLTSKQNLIFKARLFETPSIQLAPWGWISQKPFSTTVSKAQAFLWSYQEQFQFWSRTPSSIIGRGSITVTLSLKNRKHNSMKEWRYSSTKKFWVKCPRIRRQGKLWDINLTMSSDWLWKSLFTNYKK